MLSAELMSEIVERLDYGKRSGRHLFDDHNIDTSIKKWFDAIDDINVPVYCVFIDDEKYPEQLRYLPKTDQPQGLLLAGNIELLRRASVGICGSRKASDRGISVAAETCKALAQQDVVVTSGYAAGVDETAHRSALESGGATICVLAEGLTHFRIKKSLKEVWDWNRSLVVSQFGLKAIWQASRAMQRNSTIVGLSDATIVVEARETGGTLNAGLAALKLNKPLFVAEYAETEEQTAGNRLLIRNGGIPLRRSRSTGTVALSALSQFLPV